MADNAYPIDIVIPWVDGNDPLWQNEKCAYSSDSGDARVNRYRDWDNLQFLFRGIEKFLPWVRTVHFVTWGHIPDWMNSACPKLHIVNHKDYIPEEYLPVFSSHPIEMNFHRIEGLADHFIYANDDMFFLQPMEREDFFVGGYPVDSAVQNVLQFHRVDGIDHIVANNLTYLNTNFNKRKTMKDHFGKWFSLKYKTALFNNAYLLAFSNFTGFVDYHIPYAYLKSTFELLWEKEWDALDKTCRHRFRSKEDVNQWLARYWQFAAGWFVPCMPNRGGLLSIGPDDKVIKDVIVNQKYPMVCLSDDDPNLAFEYEKSYLIDLFLQILPEKSSFEL